MDKKIKVTTMVTSQISKKQAGTALAWLVCAVVVALAAISLYIGFFRWVSGEADPESLASVEQTVFASQHPNVLMYGNVGQVRALLNFSEDPDITEKTSAAVATLPMLASLGDSDVIFQSSNYFVLGAKLANEKSANGSVENDSWLAVVRGDYTEVNVRAELTQFYTIEEHSTQLLLLQPKPRQKNGETEFECPQDHLADGSRQATPLYAHINGDELVFASSATAVGAYIESQAKGAQANAHSDLVLTNWRDYRSGSLFAAQLFDQKALPRDMLTQAASQGLLAGADSQSIGVRLNADIANRSVNASFNALIADDTKVAEITSNIKSGIADLNEKNAEIYPSAVDLLSRIDVSGEQGLNLSLSLDQGVFGEVEGLFSDFLSMVFSMDSPSDSAQETATPEEVLQKHRWNYSLNDSVFKALEVTEDSSAKFLPLVNQSTVSIYMGSVGIKPVSVFDSEQGESLQLTLRAKRAVDFGDALIGWGDSGIEQSLHIKRVVNRLGKNLLTDERCVENRFGKNLNHQPDTSSNYSNGVISTSKTVRFESDVDINDIASITGEYAINVPINIIEKDVSMSSPAHSWQGGAFKLTSNKHGSVSYVLSDEGSLLLDVVGLNAKGQALSQQMSFSTGKQHTRQYKGEVASVRLILAGEFKQERFDFEVDNIIPELTSQAKAEAQNIKELDPVVVSSSELSLLNNELSLTKLTNDEVEAVESRLSWDGFTLDGSKDNELGHAIAGASALLFKHDLKSTWQNQLQVKALFPHLAVLPGSDNLVTATLILDGKPVESVPVKISKMVSNGQVRPLIKAGSLALDAGHFSVDLEKGRGKIQKIEGFLEYKLPTKITKQTFDLAKAAQQGNVSSFTFREYSFTWQGNTSYQVGGELSNAYLIRLTASDGTQQFGRIDRDRDPAIVTFEGVKKAVSIDVFTLEDTQILKEEILFTPRYAE